MTHSNEVIKEQLIKKELIKVKEKLRETSNKSLEGHYYSRPEGAREEDAYGNVERGSSRMTLIHSPNVEGINTLISLVSCRYLPQAKLENEGSC